MSQITTEPVIENRESPERQLNTRIPEALLKELQIFCVHADLQIRDAVIAAVREYIAARAF